MITPGPEIREGIVRKTVSSCREISWRVSRTCDGGGCIGPARRGESVLIGNTNGSGYIAGEFTLDEWLQFVAGVKRGDYDELTRFASLLSACRGR